MHFYCFAQSKILIFFVCPAGVNKGRAAFTASLWGLGVVRCRKRYFCAHLICSYLSFKPEHERTHSRTQHAHAPLLGPLPPLGHSRAEVRLDELKLALLREAEGAGEVAQLLQEVDGGALGLERHEAALLDWGLGLDEGEGEGEGQG